MPDFKTTLTSLYAMLLAISANASGVACGHKLVIPEVKASAKRLISIDDMAALRSIETLSVSPDGRRFAILVRQGDPVLNQYGMGWFIGDVQGGMLTYVGDGGALPPGDDAAGSESRWSPDGQSIAYTKRCNDEVQLWRSSVDGRLQERLTHNDADVHDFDWSQDGQSIYFTTGTRRAEQRAIVEATERNGYRYDEDLYSFAELMAPRSPLPASEPSTWTLILKNGEERHASESEQLAFKTTQERSAAGTERSVAHLKDAAVTPVVRADGAQVWLTRTLPKSRILRVVASLSPDRSHPIICMPDECSGLINKVWWSEDGEHVLFRRMGDVDSGRSPAFYAWSPTAGGVSMIGRTADDPLRLCMTASRDQLICARETPVRPAHVVAIDMKSGEIREIADVNPEFRNIQLGRVDRFEWETPTFPWSEPGGELAGLYPKKAYGHVLYPPNFDPRKKYPTFIEPYVAQGFGCSVGSEHALHVYAANGFVVLNTSFPSPTDLSARLGAAAMKQLYSAELDFPHLTMLMESTVRALDVASARGFIDENRVGIGGVSHGTFVPLYLLQKHDRIAAISISGPSWGPHEYYGYTRMGRHLSAASYGDVGYEDWIVKPEGQGAEFWKRVDIAEHVDAIEAPILVHAAASETYGLLRLLRHMDDAGKPYDAYIFPGETHLKWQPAHLYAIQNRNLDWFRFWLQNHEDPDPAKADQYSRWHELRKLQVALRIREGGK